MWQRRLEAAASPLARAARLVAAWQGDAALADALDALPAALSQARSASDDIQALGLHQRGPNMLLAAPPGTPGAALQLVATADIDLDPISEIQSFYPLAEALARARGRDPDPDQPPHLAKVTKTH